MKYIADFCNKYKMQDYEVGNGYLYFTIFNNKTHEIISFVDNDSGYTLGFGNVNFEYFQNDREEDENLEDCMTEGNYIKSVDFNKIMLKLIEYLESWVSTDAKYQAMADDCKLILANNKE